MASRSIFLPSQLLAEKGTFWNPTLSDIMCSRIKKPSTKIADLVIIFLRRRYPMQGPSTDTSRYIPSLPEVCRFGGSPCIIIILIIYVPNHIIIILLLNLVLKLCFLSTVFPLSYNHDYLTISYYPLLCISLNR